MAMQAAYKFVSTQKKDLNVNVNLDMNSKLTEQHALVRIKNAFDNICILDRVWLVVLKWMIVNKHFVIYVEICKKCRQHNCKTISSKKLRNLCTGVKKSKVSSIIM